MSAPSPSIPLLRGSALALFAKLVDALADARRGPRAAAALLAVYALLWWAYALIAKSTQSIHFDMGEVFAWSTELAYGYPKHPPFPAWIAAAWFAVFPRADWAYYLLATTSIALALWFIWLIAARFVDGDKRAVALVLLAFAPVFNLQPLKFNSNALLIPVWAGATWLFLRSYCSRTLIAGALAGAGAAVAMLTKYWSVFLIVGFAVGAFAHPRRRDYFRSRAPWASIAVGAALLAPNIATLFEYDFYAFTYASASHADASFASVLEALANYFAGILYLAGSLLVLQIAAAPRAAAWREVVWPSDPERRFIAAILWAGVLAPAVASLALKMRLNALWMMPCWSLLPALALSAPGIAVTRRAAAAVLAAAYAVPLIALAVSPVVALRVLENGVDNDAAFYEPLAREVDRRWPQVSDRPLRYIAGPEGLAWGCTFYCRDRPRAFPSFSRVNAPWIDPETMARAGFVALCLPENVGCLAQARAIAAGNPHAREETVELARTAFGRSGPAQRFTILLSPPQTK
ncbi:MAG TPA: glycosyltransferase family 39 protein [Xanthobacteraceae bacterium]|nr:glycosyltransferase family 39 protein [Xanthobacteraceae bacterium]